MSVNGLPRRETKASLVRGYASVFALPDKAGDSIAPGAFASSLLRRPPAGIRMLWQHDPCEPIGVWRIVREDGRGLYAEGLVSHETRRGREAIALIALGALDGLSIGFRTRRARHDPRSGLRHVLELDLWEISIVTFPALPEARITL